MATGSGSKAAARSRAASPDLKVRAGGVSEERCDVDLGSSHCGGGGEADGDNLNNRFL